MLAVLTANLYLSFYEAGALGRWVRTGIVNRSLGVYFGGVMDGEKERGVVRKGGVRAFGWCEALKVPGDGDGDERWGRFLLTVTNDDNDVICLEVKRAPAGSESQYSIEILSLTTLHDLDGNYAAVQPSSVLAMAVKAGIRTSALSCGPWISNANRGDSSTTALVGVVYGTKLKMVKIDVSARNPGAEPKSKVAAPMAEFAGGYIPNHHFTGPLRWLSTVSSFQCARCH